ncbi:MAG TPA: glycoside hydrolase family 11 protein, partial [Polyangiaceae bacterium]|nr:glycoside hydrolase family 11 protein [Polyangiaceae bacterium]
MSLKRIVSSAALIVLGCGDTAADGGVDIPEFAAPLPSLQGPSTSPDPNAPLSEGSSVDTNETASNGSGVQPGSTPSSDPSNEGQGGTDLPIAAPSGDDTNGNASGEMPGTGTDSNGSTTGGNDAAGGTGNGMGTGNGGQGDPEPTPPPRPALDCSAPRQALSGGTQACSVNASGREDGQSWFMWYSGSNGCMTTFDDRAAFKATWNNSGDFLARMGLAFDETKTFDQYGTIGADLAFTRSGSAGGYSFIGIYGWSNDPLVEYYIVEDSYGNGPATPYATQQRGTINVDGANYRVYTGTKTNQPSIHGTATFLQVFSV